MQNVSSRIKESIGQWSAIGMDCEILNAEARISVRVESEGHNSSRRKVGKRTIIQRHVFFFVNVEVVYRGFSSRPRI